MPATSLAETMLSLGAIEIRVRPPYFTFASGLSSPVYTDNRLLISDVGAREWVCTALSREVDRLGLEPDVVAGTATAGIPHAALLADRLGLPLVYVRGAAKGHGKGNRIEGRLASGQQVLLIEDLISTGGSSLSAARALTEAGARVAHVLAIFSYGFAQAAHQFGVEGIPLTALLTFEQVLDHLAGQGTLSRSDATALLSWREAPESWGVASRDPEEALAVAADVPDRQAVLALADQVAAQAAYIKLNSAFIAHGPDLLAELHKRGLKTFLDLKFHDIPNTAANHVRTAASMGVSLLTVHASGGAAMIQACAEALSKCPLPRPRLLAVTALTSLDDAALAAAGIDCGRQAQVSRLARLARDNGADGVVCSVDEAASVRANCGRDFMVVTPGVRPASTPADDHARCATPAAALRAGADLLVVGRPIYRATDPKAAAEAVVAEIRTARK